MNTLSNAVADWGTMAVFLRLLLATIVGIIIGTEREIRNRGAGIKTHVLVCIGAAMAMIVAEYIEMQFPGTRADMNRFGAQVISGVGFLGVGTIVVTGRNEIRGLTTAAGLWACACVGLAAGIGYLEGTLLAMGFILFTFTVLSRLDVRLHKYSKSITFYLEFIDNSGLKDLLRQVRAMQIKISGCSLKSLDGDALSAVIVLELPDPRMRDEVMTYIENDEDITFYQNM